MSLRKAAEMALETLCVGANDVVPNDIDERFEQAIQALRQALAQPEQEPVGYVTIETISSWAKVPSIKWFKKPTEGPLYTAPPALAQPEQEPVAWVYNGILHEFDPSEFATSEVTPLYTAPPKREWVGMTDVEVESWRCNYDFFDSGLVREVEAKLKEKNT